MSRILTKSLAVLLASALALLSVMSIPASAQDDYPQPVPAATLGDLTEAEALALIALLNSPTGTTALATAAANGEITVDLGLGPRILASDLLIRIVVEYNPVVYDGPPPASGTVTFNVPSCASQVKITYFFKSGATRSETPRLSGSGCDAPVAAPAQQLAFTGNEMSLPVAAGAILIGSGGLLLLAANKRDRKES